MATTQQNTSNSRKQRPRSSRTHQCTIGNCGKTYSRAEHLSRHQLNHSRTKLYKCDVPECCCSFVRSDLYNLHRNRHMKEYLQREGAESQSPRTDVSEQSHTASALEHGERPVNSLPITQLPNPLELGNEHLSISYTPPPTQRTSSFSTIHSDAGQLAAHFEQLNQAGNISQQQLLDIDLWNNEAQPSIMMPFFGSDSYARSPFAIPDDFIQFLFNTPDANGNGNMNGVRNYPNTQEGFFENPLPNGFHEAYLPQLGQISLPSKQATFDLAHPPAILSQERSREVFEFVQQNFTASKHCSNPNTKKQLLGGDQSLDFHIMSRAMMQRHIDSYWRDFHPQLPFLHLPTFSPNETPIILLIAIIIIGAATSSDDPSMTASRDELSKFLAWNLRWEIFSSMHSQSDSLWIYQALILLEVYEKTYSSRTLHERAHIHHATTITMMRRGSFLAGRSPLDSPPISETRVSDDETMNRSIEDIWWKEWIRRESTRRVAFAAFMIDSMHAAMFLHSMVMVTHEMRLVLPCDNVLWSATSGNEVRKLEATLRSNGVTPTPFLEGLRRTLNGQEIQTNPFGRSVLLCGVLSVSWHMSQRDLQIRSLDIGDAKGERGAKWRRSIARAFDLWRDSHVPTVQSTSDINSRWGQASESVLGSRSSLYHLAQFSLNVDIVECQIFAGAKRVLGRVIGIQEVENVQRRIRKVWAPTIEARRATFYALRFLCLVFLDPAGAKPLTYESILEYASSNNVLPVDDWVLYSAALVVWAYSYAVDGPTHIRTSTGTSMQDDIKEMDGFLRRADNIRSPEDIVFHRFNSCGGMMKVLCHIFKAKSWDLLLEGAGLLENCIKMIDDID